MKALKTIRRFNEMLDDADVTFKLFEKITPARIEVFPIRLVQIHTALILLSMFVLYKRWYVPDLPFDCFYIPFLLISGPLVYFIAHDAQHLSGEFLSNNRIAEHFCKKLFSNDPIMLPWNFVPGSICLIFGGIQWWLIGRLFIWCRVKFQQLFHSLITPNPPQSP